MLIYWLIFCVPAFLTIYDQSRNQHEKFNILWLFFLLSLISIIGFRYQVGGDWLNYMEHLHILKNLDFQYLSLQKEIGYYLLTWYGANVGGGIYIFNLFAAIVFSWGLIRFCLLLPRPWLAVTVSVPYLVIVISMGYTRQSVSLGAMMLGLVALEKNKNKTYILWVIIGYLFHKTSLLLIPLAFLIRKQSFKGENLLLFIMLLPLSYEIYNMGISHYAKDYLEAKYNSSGALIRLILNFVPSLLYLFLKKRFDFFSINQHKICYIFSISSCILFLLYFVVPSSTALDRFALYFQPLQLMVWSSIPDVFGIKGRKNLGWVFFVILIYAIIEFVWLFFGHYSGSWIPYRFYWWEVLTDRIWMFNSLTQYI